MLAAVIIPRHCDEMIEATQYILSGKEIPVIVVDKTSYVNEVKQSIERYDVTTGLIITFSFRIPSSVYSLTPKGFYNVHPGPLPQYRGSDPIFQQIKNKEKQAGVTMHKLSDQFDAGPIVMKEMIRLEVTDTYGILTTRLSQVAARLSMVLVKLISFDIAIPSKAQDELKAVYYKRQAAGDVTINWQLMDSDSIIALINACNPWNKGASTKIHNKIIRFLEAEYVTGSISDINKTPGTIISFDDKGMIVSTLNNRLIRVRIIYVDEGFVSAMRLVELGVKVDDGFEAI